MFSVVLAAAVLVTLTVIAHAVGFALLLRWMIDKRTLAPSTTASIAWHLTCVAWWLVLIHGTEVAIWAWFYARAGCMPDAESAFYLSGVTYATVGYGDCVLPKPWRLLGAIEGLTGILMCGLSTGLFFAVASRLFVPRLGPRRNRSADREVPSSHP